MIESEINSDPEGEQGFVIPRDDIFIFLDEKLSFVGLNDQEISDFIDYWLPRMQEYPYYFITFLQ